MLKRAFDIFFSFLALLVLLPVFILIFMVILVASPGPVFFVQKRVGRNGIDFSLLKFRTMHINADKKGLLTVGGKDPRITRPGYFLRKYKLDELPQLINVLIGQMSVVGPRPEVRKYVELYNEQQRQVLKVKPGITDYASLQYFNENELLAKAENPEEVYIREVMPAKLDLNRKYIEEAGMITDLKIISKTVARIFS